MCKKCPQHSQVAAGSRSFPIFFEPECKVGTYLRILICKNPSHPSLKKKKKKKNKKNQADPPGEGTLK